jgi:hypothetical protein
MTLKLALITALVMAFAIGTRVLADLPPAPETGTPNGQRTPGGTRPELKVACKQTDEPVTALVPENGKGLTSSEHPVFWFYIPYTPQEVSAIEFSLHDWEETKTLYRTSLQLTNTPGIISVPLPSNPKYSLKFNESYHWYFVVNCQPQKNFENDIVLDGWVTRVQQSNSLWYDELTSLAKLNLSEPQNPEVKKAWIELLKSVGLKELAQAPLISYLQLRKD